MFSARHRQAAAEEEHAEAGPLHPLDQIHQLFKRQARRVDKAAIDRSIVDQGSQRGQHFEIRARSDLQKLIAGPRARRFTNVHQHHRPILPPPGHELALRSEGELVEVPRVALNRVGAPVDDEVGAVFHFAERARQLAGELTGDLPGPCVSDVWLSITAPIRSASIMAARCDSHVELPRP